MRTRTCVCQVCFPVARVCGAIPTCLRRCSPRVCLRLVCRWRSRPRRIASVRWARDRLRLQRPVTLTVDPHRMQMKRKGPGRRRERGAGEENGRRRVRMCGWRRGRMDTSRQRRWLLVGFLAHRHLFSLLCVAESSSLNSSFAEASLSVEFVEDACLAGCDGELRLGEDNSMRCG